MAGFRAIIVGAGPAGLVLAHALQASGIDFVLVEQRAQVPPSTAFGLFLWPHVMRIFNQLGLMNKVMGVAVPMTGNTHQSPDGKVIATDNGFTMLEAVFGYPVTLFDRGSFAQTLVEALKDWRQHVKTSKRVTNIINRSDSVKVEFADGSFEEGSIVVGCDGVWSTVRDHMGKGAPEGLFDVSPNPFEAPYTGLFGRAPRPQCLEPGRIVHVYKPDRQMQVFASETEAHIIAYQRIPPSRERTYLDEGNAEDMAKQWLDVPVTKELTFGDLWSTKIVGGKANFDEGVLPWWHWGRMVLVGDAAHKMNPIRGAGGCSGMEDAIYLTNKLKRALRSNPNPSRSDLSRTFSAYQAEREGTTRLWNDISRLSIDLGTAATGPGLKAMTTADARFLNLVAGGPVLDDLPIEDEKEGLIPWKRKPRVREATEEVRAKL